ncbi:MAG: hypothetical protein Q8P56_02635 [Candidatus Uhrbacteria bacterium]|nr:hypothetical protein [Candidatus Uhrbacteria bacterium]
MLIKGQLAQKIIQRTGLGHNKYNIKRHIDMAAEKKVISHDEAKHLKNEYERLYLGKPIPEHEVKELLNKLKDKKLNIPGTYLRTTASNAQKVIDISERLVHVEERQHIMEDNMARNEELEKIAHDKEENEEDKKKREEEEKRAHQKGQFTVMKGGRSGSAPHHDGAPLPHIMDGKKAA